MVSEKYSERLRLSLAGEFLVAAKLLLMGYDAYLTLKNYPKIDVFVHNPKSDKTIGLQVKTTKETSYHILECPYSEIDERLDEVVKCPYVFVHVANDKSISYYVVPDTKVKELVKEAFKRYLEKSAKEETKRKLFEGKTKAVLMLPLKDIEKYKDNWKLIEKLLK